LKTTYASERFETKVVKQLKQAKIYKVKNQEMKRNSKIFCADQRDFSLLALLHFFNK